MMNLEGQTPQQLGNPGENASNLKPCDRWILSRYYHTVQQTCEAVDTYGLGDAAKTLYEFIWGDFCDWYIELVKSRLQEEDAASRRVAQQTLAFVLEGILKLLHPFVPHITEEIWHTLTQAESTASLAVQSYPEADANLIDGELESDFQLIIGAIRTIRNLRAEMDIKPGAKIKAILQSDSDKEREILQQGEFYIEGLAKVADLTITPALAEEPEQTFAGVVGTVQVLVPLTEVLDIEQLFAKLQKNLGKKEAEVKSLSGRLSNSKFVDKAPPDVVQGARDNLAEAEKQREILRNFRDRVKARLDLLKIAEKQAEELRDRLRQLRGE
jgi:valyl-tRNA synthetase